MEKLPKRKPNLSVPNFEHDSYLTENSKGTDAFEQKPKIPTSLRNQFEREWANAEGMAHPQKKHKENYLRSYDDSVSIYMRNIGKYPLLTKDGEAVLSSLIEEGRNAEPETEQYWKGVWAKDKLVVSNLRLVVSIAKKYKKNDGVVTLLDLVQEGAIGLERAATKFDWRKGFKFSTYATWWIKQSIGRSGLTLNTSMHVPNEQKDLIRKVFRVMTELESAGRPVTAEEVAGETQMDIKNAERLMQLGQTVTSISLSKPVESISGSNERSGSIGDTFGEIDDNFDSVEVQMCLEAIRISLEELSEKERDILSRRYGFYGNEEQTYREIGEEYGVTHEAIRQIEKRVLKKMRESGMLEDLLREIS